MNRLTDTIVHALDDNTPRFQRRGIIDIIRECTELVLSPNKHIRALFMLQKRSCFALVRDEPNPVK